MTLALLAALALHPAPAAAAPPADSDSAFAAALQEVRAKAAPIPDTYSSASPVPLPLAPRNPPHAAAVDVCQGFEGVPKLAYALILKGAAAGADLAIPFRYAGCGEFPRNDYLPPYTELDFRSPDGRYSMAIVTDEGAEVSAVVLAFLAPGRKPLVGPDAALLSAANVATPGTWELDKAITFIDVPDGRKETAVKAALEVKPRQP